MKKTGEIHSHVVAVHAVNQKVYVRFSDSSSGFRTFNDVQHAVKKFMVFEMIFGFKLGFKRVFYCHFFD